VQKSFTQGSTTTTTNYLYDGPNVLEEVDNNGNEQARYTQGLGIDQPLAQLRSATTSYYEQDGLGSISSLSSTSSMLVNTYTYDSFGKLTTSTGSVVNPFQYTSRESDSESGLYYYRSRYQDSTSGRFLSEDPLEFVTGSNFYRYVGNSPTNLVDRFGLSSDKPCVNIDKLADCIMEQFDILLLSFSPTIGNGTNDARNRNGSATVLPTVPLVAVTIVNDISKGWQDAPTHSGAYQDPNVSGANGWTDPRNPYTNYTLNSTVDQAAMDTQIWELGNSLAYITNTMPKKLKDWTHDPGATLLKCYLNAVGRSKDIDWEK
jgi:RHS repeat-associated protein